MSETQLRTLAEAGLQEIYAALPDNVYASRPGIVAAAPRTRVAFRRENGRVHMEKLGVYYPIFISEHQLPADLEKRAARLLDSVTC
jgi:hypothetical protein